MQRRLALLIQSLWLGGIVATDGIAAPAWRRTPGLDRAQVGAVGQEVFGASTVYQLGLGLAGVVVSRRAPRWRLGAVALQATATAVQYGYLRPRLAELREALDFDDEDRSDPRFADFGRLHGQYAALDGTKAVLAAAQILTTP